MRGQVGGNECLIPLPCSPDMGGYCYAPMGTPCTGTNPNGSTYSGTCGAGACFGSASQSSSACTTCGCCVTNPNMPQCQFCYSSSAGAQSSSVGPPPMSSSNSVGMSSVGPPPPGSSTGPNNQSSAGPVSSNGSFPSAASSVCSQCTTQSSTQSSPQPPPQSSACSGLACITAQSSSPQPPPASSSRNSSFTNNDNSSAASFCLDDSDCDGTCNPASYCRWTSEGCMREERCGVCNTNMLSNGFGLCRIGQGPGNERRREVACDPTACPASSSASSRSSSRSSVNPCPSGFSCIDKEICLASGEQNTGAGNVCGDSTICCRLRSSSSRSSSRSSSSRTGSQSSEEWVMTACPPATANGGPAQLCIFGTPGQQVCPQDTVRGPGTCANTKFENGVMVAQSVGICCEPVNNTSRSSQSSVIRCDTDLDCPFIACRTVPGGGMCCPLNECVDGVCREVNNCPPPPSSSSRSSASSHSSGSSRSSSSSVQSCLLFGTCPSSSSRSSQSSVIVHNECRGDECVRGGGDFCSEQGKVCLTTSNLPCIICIGDTPSSSSSSRSSSSRSSERSSSRSTAQSSQIVVYNECLGNECFVGGDSYCAASGESCVQTATLPCIRCEGFNDISGDISGTDDSSASSNTSFTTSSSPFIQPPFCEEPAECESNLCINNTCTDCTNNYQCPSNLCIDGTCTNCTENNQCASNLCMNGTCMPCTSSSQCEDGLVCRSGICTQCTADNQCPTDHVCRSNICIPDMEDMFCDANEDCPTGFLCILNRCVLAQQITMLPDFCGNARIDAGEQCDNGIQNTDASGSTCHLDCSLPTDRAAATQTLPAQIIELPFVDSLHRCSGDADCAAGEICLNGVCSAACTDHSQCASGLCLNGRCVACTSDLQCPDNRICRSGMCVDRTSSPQNQTAPSTPSTGPAALAVMLAGGAAGLLYRRRK